MEIDWSDFEKLEKQFGPVLLEECRFGLGDFMARFEKHMKTERMSGNWKNPMRRGVATRTGAMKASLKTWIEGTTLDSLAGHASIGSGPASKYTPMQEFGGTIRAKGKYLTIPVESPPGSGNYPALTNAGVARFPSARSANLDLIIRKSSDGRFAMFLGKKWKAVKGESFSQFSKRGGGEDVLYYILKKSVTIKPKLGYHDTFKDHWATQGQKTVESIGNNIARRFTD